MKPTEAPAAAPETHKDENAAPPGLPADSSPDGSKEPVADTVGDEASGGQTEPSPQPSPKGVLDQSLAKVASLTQRLDVIEQAGRQAIAKHGKPDPLASGNVFRVSQILRQWDGRLNRDLKRTEGVDGLGQVPEKAAPAATVTSVCGFCSTGCGLKIHLDEDGQGINITPRTDYPVNLGMACPKGWESLSVLDSEERAATPMLRNAQGELEPVDWDTALKAFTKNFKQTQAKHGKESVAFISTGQICTEEMALLGALGKFGMGIKHGDGNTRQCMATSVVAYKQSFGFDAPPYTYRDYEESDVIFLIGANPAIAHPIMWQRIWQNAEHRGKQPKIIVVDPRRSESAALATEHVAIEPKSDLIFFYGLAHILIRDGLINRGFIDQNTNGFDDFAEHVQKYTPQMVAEHSGIPLDQLERTAATIAEGKAVSFWWTMGVNQSYEGVRVAQSIINLALMTGNIGRPGTGANSITGQCNAMGSRLFSNTTNLLGGHDFANPEHRAKVRDILGVDDEVIPTDPGLSYFEIVDGIERGTIKGLWVIATNGAHSWINQSRFKKLLDKLEFLVVQDMYHTTETAQHADLILPAAAWGEKDGTFINSERRIGPVTRVRQAPGEALSDFNILKLIAHYWGCGSMFRDWSSPEATFQILQKLSAGQPCDFSGIDGYQMLHEEGGVQWPFSKEQAAALSSNAEVCGVESATASKPINRSTHQQKGPERERRLFEDGRFYHADGRAKFLFAEPTPMPEPVDTDYPFMLLTGRGTSSQWHTQSRTNKSAVLRKLYPKDPYVEIHPDDAISYGIVANQWIKVLSRRGEVTCRAMIAASVKTGQLFMPMHDKTTNRLTHESFDPYSKQPSYKACAVKITVAPTA